MSKVITSNLDNAFLYALSKADLNTIDVRVKPSYQDSKKNIYIVYLYDTIMDYELKEIASTGFRMVWISTFRKLDSNRCALEVAFKEQE